MTQFGFPILSIMLAVPLLGAIWCLFAPGSVEGKAQGARITAIAATKLDSATAESALKAELAQLDADVVTVGAELTARGAEDVADRLRQVEQLRERRNESRRRGLDLEQQLPVLRLALVERLRQRELRERPRIGFGHARVDRAALRA